MKKEIYFDNHTTTRPSVSALEKMAFLYREKWGAPAAFHAMGQEAAISVDLAIEGIKELLGAEKEDTFFLTSGNADNGAQIFFSHYLDVVRETGRTHILVLPTLDASLHFALNRVEKLGCVKKILPVNVSGQLTPETLEEMAGPRSSLLYISWANPLTGVIQPIFDLAKVCREKEIKLCTDVSYALGKLFFRFQDLAIDFLTFDGEMVHGPKGIGGLLVKKGTAFTPLRALGRGWGAPLLAALGDAVEKNHFLFDHLCIETAGLRDRLEKGILAGYPEAMVLFKESDRLPNCSAMAFPGIHGESLIF